MRMSVQPCDRASCCTLVVGLGKLVEVLVEEGLDQSMARHFILGHRLAVPPGLPKQLPVEIALGVQQQDILKFVAIEPVFGFREKSTQGPHLGVERQECSLLSANASCGSRSIRSRNGIN